MVIGMDEYKIEGISDIPFFLETKSKIVIQLTLNIHQAGIFFFIGISLPLSNFSFGPFDSSSESKTTTTSSAILRTKNYFYPKFATFLSPQNANKNRNRLVKIFKVLLHVQMHDVYVFMHIICMDMHIEHMVCLGCCDGCDGFKRAVDLIQKQNLNLNKREGLMYDSRSVCSKPTFSCIENYSRISESENIFERCFYVDLPKIFAC